MRPSTTGDPRDVRSRRRARRTINPLIAAAVVASLLGVQPGEAKTVAPATPAQPPAVIAIPEAGLNVLHEDFALPGGGDAVLPAGLPPVEPVALPTSGTFEERVEEASAGPLGHLQPGVLYYVRGTRVLVYNPGTIARDVFASPDHGTGVTSAAVGLEYGTNPDALAVLVVERGVEAWEWMAEQSWIDAVSTSYITVLSGAELCHEARYIRDIVAEGRMSFSAVGNGEQAGEVMAPSGVPESYQVGGVDSEGRTYLPASQSSTLTTNRPYETGDRFDFPAASSAALTGPMDFGGTSGATPSTAGRATELVQHARTLLRSRFTGARDGALALLGRGGRAPAHGPLADGDLTSAELTDLLHHIAVPAEPPGPARYLMEGYGALNHDEAIALGKSILAGTAELPERPEEDSMHALVEDARATMFSEGRCT